MSVSCQQLFRKVDGDLKERSENNQFSIVPERSDEGNRMGDEEARRRSVTQKLIDSYDLCQAVISILFFS